MPRPPKYTDEELLVEIRRLAKKLGRSPPLKSDMEDYGEYWPKTYQNRWGSWSDAVAAAGFEPREKGTGYSERPEECPLCKSEESGLDFHHWRYGEDEVGCYLCRDCHDAIHEGEANREYTDWLVPCITNTVRLHLRYNPGQSNPEAILNRYNLPDVSDIVEAAIGEKGE